MKTILLTMAILASLLSPANAMNEKTRQVSNDLSHELIICAAFFAITAQGIGNRESKDAETIDMTLHYSKMALLFAEKLATAIGQKPEVLKLRLKNRWDDLMGQMDNHYMNWQIIASKYQDPCFAMLRDPEATMAARLGLPE